MPNDLARSSSPYLRQHAENPVEWREWGSAAFAAARERDVPLLVSIGYSTCHWCHVMAHECFEDVETAAVMNQELVCVKLDREVHPEVDAIYMDAVQALTGHGGWPLNAFCDHEGRPFYACTYLPRGPWQQLVRQLGELWRRDRDRIVRAASELTAHLTAAAPEPGRIDASIWERLGESLLRTYDARDPGFVWNAERAPKFPPSTLLNLLLDCGRPAWTAQAESVLEAMQDAGIHDRVGGGFHRYSVDRQWRVPHFEKMLYDQALLIAAYARAGALLDRPDFLRTAVNAGDFLLRDLRLADGGHCLGYATALDADDPGGEGSYYAWEPAQLRDALGESDAARLVRAFDLRAGHRERGRSGHDEPVASHIPHPRGVDLAAIAVSLRPAGAPPGPATREELLALRASWEPALPRLRAVREQRPAPQRDDKVLTDQNALALEAFAMLARFSAEPRFRDACQELAGVLLGRCAESGLLRLPGERGEPGLPGIVTDYGGIVAALPAAFSVLGDPRLIDTAERLAHEALALLRAEDGGFYMTPAGRSDLIRRSRESTDQAWPAGQSLLALGLVRLYHLTGAASWRSLAEDVLAAAAGTLRQAPTACATLLAAQALLERGPRLAIVAGAPEETADLLACCRAHSEALLTVVPLADCRDRSWACLDGRRELSEPCVLICTADRCLAPARTVEEVAARLDAEHR